MNKEKKNRIFRISFILNGALFLLSAVDFIDRANPVFLAVLFAAAISNLVMFISFKRLNENRFLNVAIFILNIIVALFTAIDYFQQGKVFIQYVWLFTALVTVIALIISMRKNRQIEQLD